jgi:putative acetyltransferase
MGDKNTNEALPTVSKPLVGLLLRAVQPKDAEAVAELVNLPGYRWGTLRLPFHTPEEIRIRIEKAAPGSLGLVAVVDGQVVGNAGLERLSGRRAHAGRLGMGVHDAWAGRGVGSALLAALLDAADNWLDLQRVELTVWTDNVPALALYRRCGFEVEGTHRGYAFRDGRYVDAYAMARLHK